MLKRMFSLFLCVLLLCTGFSFAYAQSAQESYQNAKEMLSRGEYTEAQQVFAELGAYEEASLYEVYTKGLLYMESGNYTAASACFGILNGFLDSDHRSVYCTARGYDAIELYEAAAEEYGRILPYLDAAALYAQLPEKILARDYRYADAYERENKLEKAYDAFIALKDYKDSKTRAANVLEKIHARDYAAAEALEEAGQLEKAYEAFQALIPYSDSESRAQQVALKILARDYAAAEALEEAGQLEKAYEAFQALIPYSDSESRAQQVALKILAREYAAAEALEKAERLEEACEAFQALIPYSDSESRAQQVMQKIYARAYAEADKLEKQKEYLRAYNAFIALKDYKDSAARAKAIYQPAMYAQAMQYTESGEYQKAYLLFTSLGNWQDCERKAYILSVSTFAEITFLGGHCYAYKFHDVYGLINLDNNQLTSALWETIDRFDANGLAKVKLDNKYGLIDRAGKVVLQAQYDSISAFDKNGLAKAGKDNKYGLFTTSGKAVLNVSYAEIRTYDQGKAYKAATSDKNTKNWNVYSPAGEKLLKQDYAEIGEFSEGYAVVKTGNGKYGYIDRTYNVAIAPGYDAAFDFHEERAMVLSGNGKKCGYIDPNGKLVIPALYEKGTSFSNGLAEVYLKGTGWQVIDKQGNIIYFAGNETEIAYQEAVALMEAGQYEAAIKAFEKLNGYKNSIAYADTCKQAMYGDDYATAVALMDQGEYRQAMDHFKKLKDYKDSAQRASACQEAINAADYAAAEKLLQAGKYDQAIAAFEALKKYSDSEQRVYEAYYQKAKQQMNVGDYTGAYTSLVRSNGYKDAASLLQNDPNLKQAAYKIHGGIITFGRYEQDNNINNGKEPIEWIVLDYDQANNRTLVISRYGLDAQPYNKQHKNITWEKCTLRTWLNADFLNAAFTKQEQKAIPKVVVKAEKNPAYDTDPGKDTQNKVFLLSVVEVQNYFTDNAARMCAPTDYAIQHGAWTGNSTINGMRVGNWWLRSPGYNQDRAANVYADGSLSGDRVNYSSLAVRPALYIDLDLIP